MSDKPVVYIVDDDEGIRKALILLMKTNGLKYQACASASEFLELYDVSKTGCLLLDVRMPGMSGLELQEQLTSNHIILPVIIMTGHADVSMAVQAMRNGAKDFIEKPFKNQDVLDAVQCCISEAAIQYEIVEKQTKNNELLALLTRREKQVMHLLVDGNANKKIAEKLNISVRTVDIHRANIMKKLNIKNLVELVHMVFRQDESMKLN